MGTKGAQISSLGGTRDALVLITKLPNHQKDKSVPGQGMTETTGRKELSQDVLAASLCSFLSQPCFHDAGTCLPDPSSTRSRAEVQPGASPKGLHGGDAEL